MQFKEQVSEKDTLINYKEKEVSLHQFREEGRENSERGKGTADICNVSRDGVQPKISQLLKRKVPESGKMEHLEKESKQFKTTINFTPTNSLENSPTNSICTSAIRSGPNIMISGNLFSADCNGSQQVLYASIEAQKDTQQSTHGHVEQLEHRDEAYILNCSNGRDEMFKKINDSQWSLSSKKK